MKKSALQPFAAWATRFRSRLRTDPFVRVRFQLMLSYFVIGVVIFMFFGWFFTSLGLSNIYETSTLVPEDIPLHEALAAYESEMLRRRLFMVVLFTIATYFLTEFAMRPIRKSVELQERFIAIVSHELRTPLTVMKNMAEVALRNPEGISPEKAQKLIRSNLEETNKLTDTIKFLLAFSSLKIQKEIPDVELVELKDIAGTASIEIAERAEDQGIELSTSFEGDTTVRGNPTALRGVVANLLRNALNHTPRGGRVSLNVSGRASEVQLTVTDTGRGVAKKDLPFVFEPFYRGNEDAREPGEEQGLGLGLSIVKEVVTLHRGKVGINSVPGQGTQVYLTFPKV